MSDRVAPRYQTAWAHPLRAELIVGLAPHEVTLDCQLADLSQRGCSLRFAQPPRVPPKFGIVRVIPPASTAGLVAAGRLCWHRRTGVGTITYGFQFRRAIDESCLKALLESDLITQREQKRDQVNLSVQVRQQNPALVLKQANLVNVSNSGLQLSTEVPLTVGARVLVILPDSQTGIAEVVWSSPGEAGNLAGAGFTAIDAGRRFYEQTIACVRELSPGSQQQRTTFPTASAIKTFAQLQN